MAELIARRRAHRILVVSPAGPLLEQWRTEMRDRFGLRFETITSSGELQERRRSLVLGANPFDHVSYCLTSIDFAKQEKVLQELERTVWDLVVIDEAHHCVSLGSGADSEDSQRRRLAEVLARQTDGLLLLTATPHDGYDAHFASVVELLDPSLVDGRGGLRGERYRQHVVRRLKQHIKDPETGEPLFKDRQVFPCAVTFAPDSHPQFAAFQQALIAAIAPRLKQAVRRQKYGEVLAFLSLLKRSVSTTAACLQTLTRIRDRYTEMASSGEAEAESRRQRLKTLSEYRKRLERFGALSFEEEQDQAFLEAEDMAADLLDYGLEEFAGKIEEIQRTQRRLREQGKRIQTTRDALDVLIAMAQEALAEDPKLGALLREVKAIRMDKAKANLLVYTEYTDSQDAVLAYLREALSQGDLQGEVLAISGSDSEATRTAVTERFKTHDGIVLVSTDATSEGLNLHARCHHLLHVELPYNPNRLEQRNGRIDRYGQKEIPMVRYLYLAGSFEERLLMRLVAKYERQRLRLTFVPNTLGGLTTDDAQTVRLLEGLAEEENCLFKVAPREIRLVEEEPEDTTTPAYQELLSEVERAMTGFEKNAKSHAWLGDAGLNAEARLVADAELARQEGASLSDVDLLKFVCAALEADAQAGAIQRGANGVIELRLPPSWDHGLKDLPGYDASGPTLLLTEDHTRNQDERERKLGFLGRAHPVVRRALSRVRNIRFGEAGVWLDRRVSALAASVDHPALLCTYLGAIESPRGHEFERVLGVKVEQDGRCTVFDHPDQWLKLLDGGKAISPKDLWDRHFTAWGEAWSRQALDASKAAFEGIAEPWYSEHARLCEDEYEEVEKWLRTRVEAICGPVQQAQPGLFEEAVELPRWATQAAPLERLAAYATDGKNPVAARREADGILRLFRMREKDLAAHRKARTLAPIPLGLLMLLPLSEGGR
ncbi:hypothetical protein METEAL_23090 [Mesoterricola silvestris]|uniref:Helicase n=2 Tax=Mesoterricola silvestris TaxID=2927979 RepID=A0AA48GP71_9BACT|nr:hypothetical protein METEAL_23090 [Mesoterricola silvestris]